MSQRGGRSLLAVTLAVVVLMSLVTVGVGTATATPMPVSVSGTTWGVTLGTPSSEVNGLVATSDGGYVAATYDRARDVNSLTVVKLDASGTEVWRVTPPGSQYAVPTEAIGTADGGIVVVAVSHDGFFPNDVESRQPYVVKLDASGTVEWEQLLPRIDGNDVRVRGVTETDVGYVVVGFHHANAQLVDEQFWVPYAAMITSDGRVAWTRSYAPMRGTFEAVAATADGDVVAVGSDYTSLFTTSVASERPLFVRLGPDGEREATQVYSGGDGFIAVHATSDGFVALDEYYNRESRSSDLRLLSLTEDGELRWARGYDVDPASGNPNLLVDGEGRIVFAAAPAGSIGSDSPRNVQLVWVTSDGAVFQTGEYGTAQTDSVESLALGPNSEVVAAGFTYDRTDRTDRGDALVFAVPPATGGPASVTATSLSATVTPIGSVDMGFAHLASYIGPGNTPLAVAGTVLAVIVLVPIVAVVWFLRRRRGRKRLTMEPPEPSA